MTASDDFNRFVTTDYVRLVRAVALFCGSLPLAEDAVHDAVAKALKRLESGYVIERPEGWLFTVACNEVRRQSRLERRHSPLADTAGAQLVLPDVTRFDVRAAVLALPDRQRQVVVLHYYLERSVVEMASILGVSTGTVKTALFRARRHLGRALEPTMKARP